MVTPLVAVNVAWPEAVNAPVKTYTPVLAVTATPLLPLIDSEAHRPGPIAAELVKFSVHPFTESQDAVGQRTPLTVGFPATGDGAPNVPKGSDIGVA